MPHHQAVQARRILPCKQNRGEMSPYSSKYRLSTYGQLKQPSNFGNDILHVTQVEKHAGKKTEKENDTEDLEHEDAFGNEVSIDKGRTDFGVRQEGGDFFTQAIKNPLANFPT